MAKTKTKFSGHDKFDCKIDWITKGLKAYNENSELFTQSIEESIKQLGLGINMIKSLNHWMKVLGLIEDKSLTLLGKMILERDSYLESIDTLWLLHWNLVKQRDNATLYNLFFNLYYPNKFTKEEIVNRIMIWLDERQIKLSSNTIKSDMDVFIRMYRSSDKSEMSLSLFSDLQVIMSLSHDSYLLNINGVEEISDEVFLYILMDYIEFKYQKRIESISIDDIQRGVLSIQKSLCMSENSLYMKIRALDKLTNSKIYFSEASGIRQIYIQETIDKSELLKKIYQ